MAYEVIRIISRKKFYLSNAVRVGRLLPARLTGLESLLEL